MEKATVITTQATISVNDFPAFMGGIVVPMASLNQFSVRATVIVKPV